MSRFDLNCMVGHWPFRKLRHNKPEDILKTHKQNGITGGCVSSLDSILYNDPYEGDEDLVQGAKEMGYIHIQSVNPILSFTTDDIKRGVELLGTKGVKIYPCYHQYGFDAPELEPVCEYLKEQNIPLFVQLRMEDYRADYVMLQKQLGVKDLQTLLNKYPDNKIVLLTPRLNEINALAPMVKESDNVLFDTSGLKDGLFSVETVVNVIGPDKLAFGSLYPLFCLKSILMLVEEAQLDEDIKQKIYSGNAERFLGL
ncbi:MAG TPA: hypothetical protein DDZ89_13365 [Clostridiales bacterium]|nr:hypothetical protein [Clostridiales bacterium]